MPKKSPLLAARTVDSLRNDGRYAVGGVDGLYLYIKNSRGYWVLRTVDQSGIRREIGLGRYLRGSGEGDGEGRTLEGARNEARRLRQKIAAGDDPIAERRAARAAALLARAKDLTFAQCAKEYIETYRVGWKNPKHAAQWESTLATYAIPKIGKLRVHDVDLGLVLAVLQQPVETDDGVKSLWLARNETASRLRGRIEKILDWATVRKLRQGENPARWKGTLNTLLPRPDKVQGQRHQPALPYNEMAGFMADLRQHQGVSPRALEFVILTACRSGEVFGATWQEIDLSARTWTIPAARMKAGREHTVPLSDAAVALLEALPRVVGNDLVFPAPRGGRLSDMALTTLVRKMHAASIEAGGAGYVDPKQGSRIATAHGFRSTFRDWAAEITAFPREVIEHALAHRLADASEAAYQRGPLLAKRARLMAEWASYVSKPMVKGDVIQLRARDERI